MIFPNYRAIVVFGICIAPLLLGILLFRVVRSTRPLVKIPTRIISALLCLCGVCLLLLDGFMSHFTSTEHSSAIYSPDHRKAIRVETWDAGAAGGGGTDVVLYSHLGLVTKTIFSGDYVQTDKSSIRWLSNSQVLIEYDNSYTTSPAPICEGDKNVSVKCEAIAFTYPRTVSN